MMITWWFNVSKFVLTKIWNHDMLGWAWLSEVSNFTYRLRELPLTCKVVVGGLNPRMNFLKERGNNGDQGKPSREKRRAWERKNLIGLGSPTIRERAKKEKEMLLEKEINTTKLKPKVRKKSPRCI